MEEDTEGVAEGRGGMGRERGGQEDEGEGLRGGHVRRALF